MKVKSIIPSIAIGGDIFTRVKSFKLLGVHVWIDDDFKWNTNTDYISSNIQADRPGFLGRRRGGGGAEEWRKRGGGRVESLAKN